MNEMNEHVKQTLLYDFYGELLNAHQKEIYEQYLLEDYSLGEIALEVGTSRQAVHDVIKRCNHLLSNYEEKLHLVEKFMQIRIQIKEIEYLLKDSEEMEKEVLVQKIQKISHKIVEEL